MVAMLVAATIGLQLLSHGEEVSLAKPLAMLPLELGPWKGRDFPVEERIITAVAVDDHLNRVYWDADGRAIALYVGYYKSQRTGQTIHSPKNCLPGAGWQPVSASQLNLAGPDGGQVAVNLYVIEKGLERQLVLYWYQSHGRIIASEYWGKIYMVLDAIRLNRTDSALVRIVTADDQNDGESRQRAAVFAELVLAQLGSLIPR